MNTNTRLKSCVYTILAAATVSATAAAQQKATVLEEIVVTAQKRSENLQDVPIAISAFTDKERDLIGIRTIQDFTNFTPGITYSTQLDRMSVRGVGRNTNNLAVSPGVASYGDGFYNSSNHQADSTPLITERVEILRGPQGTLYGRNSIGGALNVILKRPAQEWGAEARASGGNFDSQRLEGLVTGPITDWLRVLVWADADKQVDGYVHNIAGFDEFGRKNNKFVTTEFSADIGSAVDIFGKWQHSEWNEGYGAFVSRTPYSTVQTCVPVAPATTCVASLVGTGQLGPNALYNSGTGLNPAVPQYTTTNPGATDFRETNHNTPNSDTLAPSNIFTLEVVGHLGFADLKYLGGYQGYRYNLLTDFDNSDRTSFVYTPPSGVNPVTIFSTVNSYYAEYKRYYSNELNLISTNDGPLQWVAGLYQYHEHFDQPTSITSPFQTQLSTPIFATAPFAAAPLNPTNEYTYSDVKANNNSLAGFGQIDYKFTPQFKGTLGLRYTRDVKYGDEYVRRLSWNPTTAGSNTNLFAGGAPAFDLTGSSNPTGYIFTPAQLSAHPGLYNPVPTNDGTGNYTRHLSGAWHATTGTAGLEWTPATGSLGYLKFTRGYKDGGLNIGSVSASPFTDPEYVNAYELGWKQDVGSSFQVNASAFYYHYIGEQLPILDISTTPATVTTFNIASKIYGLELETTWAATANLNFLFNYSYLHTSVEDPNGCYTDSLAAISVGPKPCTITLPGGIATTPGQRIDGNEKTGSPPNKIAFNTVYTFNFQPGNLALSGSYTWRDRTYSSVFTRDEWKAPAYGQADIVVTWTAADNAYTIFGYLRNAFDSQGYDGVTASNVNGTVLKSYSLTPPRQVGVELQYRIGSSKKK